MSHRFGKPKPKPSDQKRSVYLPPVRVRPTESACIERAVKRDGRGYSEWAREILLAAAGATK